MKISQPCCAATLLTMRWPHREVVPANVFSCVAWVSLKPRTTNLAWRTLLPLTSFHLRTQRESTTLRARAFGIRSKALRLCQR